MDGGMGHRHMCPIKSFNHKKDVNQSFIGRKGVNTNKKKKKIKQEGLEDTPRRAPCLLGVLVFHASETVARFGPWTRSAP